MFLFVRTHDWRGSPLGEKAGWPQPLRTLVRVMLSSRQPMFVAWGANRILLYNDSYAPMLGERHPAALGRPFFETWPEVVGPVGALMDQVFSGEAVHMEDLELTLHRNGYPEETHFAFSYTPVPAEDGTIAGLFCACTETTQQIIAERQRGESEARLIALNANMEREVTKRSGERSRTWQVSTDLLNLFDLVHPDDISHTIEGAKELSSGVGHARFENRYRHKDGSYRSIAWWTRPHDDLINAIGRDVTTEKQQAEALVKAAVNDPCQRYAP